MWFKILKMIDEKLKNKILNIIFKFINEEECAIFLFGSFKKGRVNQSSDIDIGIICNKKLDPILVQRIKHELNEKVLKEIEIWYIGKKLKTNLESLKVP